MTDDRSSSGHRAEGVSAQDIRASHADRDEVVEILRDAAVDGRLTAEELDERLTAALNARTFGELAALTRDLPVSPLPAPTPVPRAGAVGPGKDVVEINQRFGTLRRIGPWEVPRRLDIRMHGGDVKLDFTQAVIRHAILDLDVYLSIGGDMVIVVRPGIVVATHDLAVGGDLKVRVPKPGPHEPVELRVNLTGRIRGGGDVVVRYPRRTLGQWMRGESAL
ncbi:DUF1707 domain-containing protein [Kitasatospora sp. RB6PN24]|uniref:DUF1707 SHOCT-like domain-containing protein n=1 Tax=Kitasatospora humi TaxID=2893891 RepID=UPI001E2D133E|nr:DUF1707 domain-containing protein [Kitasatospora humi]MCC9310552.1 DUF1707 domain-containing protein [Kitasatospora humi]